jgi:hypothetical protein
MKSTNILCRAERLTLLMQLQTCLAGSAEHMPIEHFFNDTTPLIHIILTLTK